MKQSIKEQANLFPATPGVYLFRDSHGSILYVGKATNLRSRVRSYFSGQDERGERIVQMVVRSASVSYLEVDSVLEALILEANLIKKYQPKYNVDLKDDKSFSYFGLTKEKFPRFLIIRGTEIRKRPGEFSKTFGPYTSKRQMEVALDIMRKIFPFHSLKQATEKGCLDYQLGRCPGPYEGRITKADYLKNIRGIRMILEGKKQRLLKKLELEMNVCSRAHEFERAAELRDKIFALQHIRDVALIADDQKSKVENFELKIPRVEAYDISNISGRQAVGSLAVFTGKMPDKSQYRKFKIKTVEGSDDVAMMREVLTRRFRNGWPKPDLILLDGGIGHLNMAAEVLIGLGLDIPLAAVAKGPERKKTDIQVLNHKILKGVADLLDDKLFIKRAMDEAHRFALQYHRKIRKKAFFEG